MELTLLGTGNPHPSAERAGPSQHLSIGGSSVLIDTGNGACRRMMEVDLEPAEVDTIFITHMHSDHTIDLAHALITGWIRFRKSPVTIVGPAQTREFVDRLLHAFEFDIKLRRLHDRVGEEIMHVEVIEVADGDTYETNGWRATAIEVDHGYVKPALGFVFEEDNRKLVLSGDTGPCDAILNASAGADVLVHELMRANDAGDPHGAALEAIPELRRRILQSHTCPHEIAPIATEADVPRLVLTHLPADPNEAWCRDIIEKVYKGETLLGHDLLKVTI